MYRILLGELAERRPDNDTFTLDVARADGVTLGVPIFWVITGGTLDSRQRVSPVPSCCLFDHQHFLCRGSQRGERWMNAAGVWGRKFVDSGDGREADVKQASQR